MLILRHEQIRALEVLKQPGLNRQVLDYLTSQYPAECQALEPEALIRLAAEAVEDAQGYGLAILRDLFSFAALRLMDGDFDRHPRIQALLHRSPRRNDTRMAEIFAALNESDAAGENTEEDGSR